MGLTKKPKERSFKTMNNSSPLPTVITAFILALPLALVATGAAAQSAQAAPPTQPATQFLDLPEGRIAYDDTGGSGPAVICVPGLGDLRQQYRDIQPLLVRDGFRVVTMDLRGMGESSVDWPTYTAANVGGDMVALIRHLDVPRAYILGNSMAGGSAVWAAAEVPERVAGLVLIDPFVGQEQSPSFAMRAAMHVLFQRPWGPAVWRTYYKSLYKGAPPADLSEYADKLEANLKERGRFEALKGMLWASQAPCAARIGQVRAPVLVIVGADDPDFDDPRAQAKSVVQHLHGTVFIVQGAGHYPHVEYPRMVANEIDGFFRSAR
jgi:pimeloyl-ACP methyl ester carboxylesterase